jgi:anti-sigma regulatory factor (Ser/Thr protein kinase)
VRHAYDGEDGSVGVAFVVGSGSLEMIVEDQGAGIAPGNDDTGEPEPESLEGGMGMSIIRAIVDDVDVREGADGKGTVVRMTKYLDATV